MSVAMKRMAQNSIIREEHESYSSRIDHDRLFKQLLHTYFSEFIELFFPEAFQWMDFENLTFLFQDVFTDITNGERRSVVILAETKLKGEETAILLHVESQAYHQDGLF